MCLPKREAVIAIAHALANDHLNAQDDSDGKYMFAEAGLIIRAILLASAWTQASSSELTTCVGRETTYDWESKYRKIGEKDVNESRQEMVVKAIPIGVRALNVVFSTNDLKNENDEIIKTILVKNLPEQEKRKSFITDASVKLAGDILELFEAAGIVTVVSRGGGKEEEKEGTCKKCEEYERREREREHARSAREEFRGNTRYPPNIEDPFIIGRGFPNHPLDPGRGARRDYIGPPDLGPGFGFNNF
jgi:hypothetical protein